MTMQKALILGPLEEDDHAESSDPGGPWRRMTMQKALILGACTLMVMMSLC
jgi:hypothetical protein